LPVSHITAALQVMGLPAVSMAAMLKSDRVSPEMEAMATTPCEQGIH
jgi:hypothetical protein